MVVSRYWNIRPEGLKRQRKPNAQLDLQTINGLDYVNLINDSEHPVDCLIGIAPARLNVASKHQLGFADGRHNGNEVGGWHDRHRRRNGHRRFCS